MEPCGWCPGFKCCPGAGIDSPQPCRAALIYLPDLAVWDGRYASHLCNSHPVLQVDCYQGGKHYGAKTEENYIHCTCNCPIGIFNQRSRRTCDELSECVASEHHQ